MYYLNDKEEKIIGRFISNAGEYEYKEITLKWEDGNQATATFDSYIEDENDYEMDDENYEEFWSFVFKALSIKGEPPIYITEDDYFIINYHNFPDEIIVGNKKIT